MLVHKLLEILIIFLFCRSSILATPTHKASNSIRQNNLLGSVKEQTSSDVERDAARVACLPPAKLVLPSDSPVVSHFVTQK